MRRNPSPEIRPQKGLSELSFGATMKEVERIFGKPEDIEKLEDIKDYETVIWNYWEKGVSLFFDENTCLFTCAEVDNTEATLWGERVFDLSEKQIIELFKSRGYHNIDEELHKWGEKRVSFEDVLVDCYFEKGKLTSLNFCVFMDNLLYKN